MSTLRPGVAVELIPSALYKGTKPEPQNNLLWLSPFQGLAWLGKTYPLPIASWDWFSQGNPFRYENCFFYRILISFMDGTVIDGFPQSDCIVLWVGGPLQEG